MKKLLSCLMLATFAIGTYAQTPAPAPQKQTKKTEEKSQKHHKKTTDKKAEEKK